MNTFHIDPKDPLAVEAAEQVKNFSHDALIAIRGKTFDYGDGEDVEIIYTVSECPDPDNVDKYAWTYVYSGDWLSEFDSKLS